ncbi:MAG: hypothetical protein COB50_00630 [Thiotrichales bacterium]|nr:MAG: hypothetical protein COB50_00630 [Thiotrichales bacterium]
MNKQICNLNLLFLEINASLNSSHPTHSIRHPREDVEPGLKTSASPHSRHPREGGDPELKQVPLSFIEASSVHGYSIAKHIVTLLWVIRPEFPLLRKRRDGGRHPSESWDPGLRTNTSILHGGIL